MIIKLKKFACFKEEEQILDTERKPKTLVYGLNGTGKTVISGFLYNQSLPEDKKLNHFNNFSLEDIKKKKILVYNQEFIKDNFYDKDRQNGIFTLSKKNKDIELEIKKLEKNFENKEKRINELENKLKENQEKKENELKKGGKNIKIKDYFKNKSPEIQNFFAKGYIKSTDKLFSKIIEVKKLSSKPSFSFDDCINDYEEVSKKTDKLIPVSEIINTFSDLEINEIFKEKIIGSAKNPFSEMINNHWENSDWIKRGLIYVKNKAEKRCPFCQQNITEKIIENLENYFDRIYENKIEAIKKIKQKYFSAKKEIPELFYFLKNKFIKNEEDNFKTLFANVLQTLDFNLKIIDEKIKKPGTSFTLKESKKNIENFNTFISEINKKIEVYNQKIQNKEESKQKIKEDFWNLLRYENDSVINLCLENIEEIDSESEKIKKNLTKEKETKEQLKAQIQTKQKETINIDEAIKNINNYLKDLGLLDFFIEKKNEQNYGISRNNFGENEETFKTLSEGEKMIISFLYFLESCKGRKSKDEITEEKIIVIDDPISSLSHNYVFNVSQLIKKELWGNKKFETLILTHNLYFFNEMKWWNKNSKLKTNLFRLVKGKNGTEILSMKENEIQNEYESYWQILKDFDQKKINENLYANVMRNILEYFFGFIEKKSYKKALDALDSVKYGAFIRYMNRESHSDKSNISDTKDIDITQFKNGFKNVFYESKYHNHYENMINGNQEKKELKLI